MATAEAISPDITLEIVAAAVAASREPATSRLDIARHVEAIALTRYVMLCFIVVGRRLVDLISMP